MRVLSIVQQADAGPGVFAEAAAAQGVELQTWEPALAPEPPVEPLSYDAAMVFGGSMNVGEEGEHPWLAVEQRVLRELLRGGVPLLGVCLGAQLLAEAAGGEVRRARRPEIGWHEVKLTKAGREDALLGTLQPAFCAFQWHSFEFEPPAQAQPLALSPVCPQATRLGELAWAIQFHAEVSRADALRWIEDYESDRDAVAMGVDPEALGAKTSERIAAWNDLGRRLCARFLELAAEGG